MNMKFTERELCLLSDGIIALLDDANSAVKVLPSSTPDSVFSEIGKYRAELMALNRKICDAMDD